MATADPLAQRSLVGAVLSRRFRLVQKLGDGGMGEVYAADPLDGSARVAIKIMRPEYLGDAPVLKRFLDEARACGRLIHPNIVRVFECAEAEDGSPYIVMELLEGVPVGAYTQNGGRVPVAQAIPILQGILAGLAAAHGQQIVHRDLKPENVFLTRDAHGVGGKPERSEGAGAHAYAHAHAHQRFVVKVLDFGIAKVMDVAGGMGNKTRTGMLLGTPAYMSPEQIKSAKDVDQRADLWSAGVMFYEMITGRVAFPAPTEYARLAAVLSTEPDPVEHVDPALAPLGPFVAKAMQKDRNLRFQSALEMARALAAVSLVGAEPASRVMVTPLSRLPDVPSLFMPSAAKGAQGAAAPAPGGAGGAVSAVPATAAAQGIAPQEPAQRSAGGTLASAAQAGGVVGMPQQQPPQVVIVGPAQALGETLPSKDLPMIASGSMPGRGRGVAPLAVVALVLGALLAGFLLGFAVARAM
jgi:serine/threonine-protein kinase